MSVCTCGGRKGEKERGREGVGGENSLKLYCYDKLYTYRVPIMLLIPLGDGLKVCPNN